MILNKKVKLIKLPWHLKGYFQNKCNEIQKLSLIIVLQSQAIASIPLEHGWQMTAGRTNLVCCLIL